MNFFLKCVDLVVLLPMMEDDVHYSNLVKKIKPDVIAVTENDPNIEKKRRQAEEAGGKLKIIPLTETYSSSTLTKIIGIE
jgi:bifunctional ADP-heptose synthase (sugar kinase/adenylyltransferase)